MRKLMLVATFALIVASTERAPAISSNQARPATTAAASPQADPVFIVYYWRARPGKAAEYSDYIRRVAEPIDEEGRKAGVFEEVHTYTPALMTGAPGADWTHMRVFKLKNIAAWESFGVGLDEAGKRVFPDEARRREVMGPAAELRDLVRQEILRELK